MTIWQIPDQHAPRSVRQGRPLATIAALVWVAFAGLAVLSGVFSSLFLLLVMMDTGGSPGLGPWYPILHIVLPLPFAFGIHRRNLAIAIAAAIYGAILGTFGDPAFSVVAFVPGLFSALAAYENVRLDGLPLGPGPWRRLAKRLDKHLPTFGRPLRWLVIIVVAAVASYGTAGFVNEASVTPLARQNDEAAAARAKLNARPEATIHFPGSVRIDGTLGTHASVNDVIAFYQRELSARGLEPGGGLSTSGSRFESQVCTWHTHEFVFRLSFWKLDDWRARHPEESPAPTMYRIELRDALNTRTGQGCLHEVE